MLELLDAYVRRIAYTFHGIRIDNCHSTPKEILKRIARVAHETRPDILIMAELFTADDKMKELVSECGINCIVRELIHSNSAQNLAGVLNSCVDPSQQIGNFYHVYNNNKCTS